VWERGRFVTIDHPRATGTIPDLISGGGAFGINNRGQVVGVYVSRDGHLHGYLWDRGRFRTIADAPRATDTAPIDINDRRQITIHASSAAEPFLNFLVDDGEFTRIQFPGAVGTTVHKIDNRGQIVGVYDDGSPGQHGFTLNRGRYRTIDFPGTTFTGVNSSNTRGQIVGYILEGDLAQPRLRGAILSRGRLTTFDAPVPPRGPAGTTAVDINDRGQIVGFKSPLPDTTAASSQQAADMAPLH
jgi:probable HAF family extracellular repeat protein